MLCSRARISSRGMGWGLRKRLGLGGVRKGKREMERELKDMGWFLVLVLERPEVDKRKRKRVALRETQKTTFGRAWRRCMAEKNDSQRRFSFDTYLIILMNYINFKCFPPFAASSCVAGAQQLAILLLTMSDPKNLSW